MPLDLALLLPALAFVLLTILGLARPLRRPRFWPLARVARNLAFSLPGLLANRLLLFPIPLAVAAWAQRHGVGVLHLGALPVWLQVLASVLWLDYAYYWWHRAMHLWPVGWRFHRVHHADEDMDASTAARFHVGEIVLSIGFRVAVVVFSGVSPSTLVLYEVMFQLAALFHHSNWRLGERAEASLSQVLVTPRLHGIHHGSRWDEANSNWGTVFSCWDRLHRTHRDDVPQHELDIGAPDLSGESKLTLKELWLLPWRK